MAYSVPNRLDYLGQRMSQINYEEVTIRRGPHSTIVQRVTLGYVAQQEMMPSGEIIDSRRMDFIMFAADYEIDSTLVDPIAGDEIERSNGEVYQVVGKQGGRYNSQESVVIPTTPTNKRIRIHTTRIQ